MSAIDRIQHELDMQGIKPSKMMSDLGFSSGLYSQWKNKNQNPSLSKLESISSYLHVDLNFLRQDELREKYKEKDGFGYDLTEAENIKNISRENIIKGDLSDKELIDNANNILKALYSRSLIACLYDSKHVIFKDYCAMLLNQNSNHICTSIPEDKYKWLKKELIKIYGQKPGISEGTYYKTSVSKNITMKTNGNISDELKFALFDGVEGVTDEMFEEVKQFASMVKMREEAKKEKK